MKENEIYQQSFFTQEEMDTISKDKTYISRVAGTIEPSDYDMQKAEFYLREPWDES